MTRLGLLFLSVFLLMGAFLAPPEVTRTVYGDDKPLGEGFLRSFVTFNADDQPTYIGVELDAAAMEGLPDHMMPPAVEHALFLPEGLEVAPFNHFSVDWVPHGHEPPGIYDRPHFDFHFYMISGEERDVIVPMDEAFMQKAAHLPEAKHMPVNYVSPPGNEAVPRMGAHLVDLSSPEFAGEPFTSTFIWGSYDGRIIFMEPMVTREYLLSLREMEEPVVFPISLPEAVQQAGYYPASYSLMYDAERDVYRLSLGKLQWRDIEA